jgi:hypothetical protein
MTESQEQGGRCSRFKVREMGQVFQALQADQALKGLGWCLLFSVIRAVQAFRALSGAWRARRRRVEESRVGQRNILT